MQPKKERQVFSSPGEEDWFFDQCRLSSKCHSPPSLYIASVLTNQQTTGKNLTKKGSNIGARFPKYRGQTSLILDALFSKGPSITVKTACPNLPKQLLQIILTIARRAGEHVSRKDKRTRAALHTAQIPQKVIASSNPL
jgi:hypothetical protein